MRYGFVGLGNLGGHLAASLRRSGFEVVVHDRDPTTAERLIQAGATWSDSAGALSRQCDAVLTCLPSPQVSQAVLGQILETARPGLTWIEMSTVGSEEILRLASHAAAKGVATMELPVTGGVHLAAQGKITMLAGGEKDLFNQHLPALQAMGEKIFYMGPLGNAAIIKVITNMLAFIHLVADGEALMLAKRGGLDLAQAWQAIKASSGNSFVHETEGQLILNGSYDIGFTMDLALKDLGFAMNLGRTFDVPLELANLTNEIFIKGKEAYGAAAPSTQIVKLLEDAVGEDLRAEGFPPRLG
ncbi:NAD(P)-dependent oxidoreductase [Ensifer sp.]|jgi:3-hydroxyisobutyrate dehydrogenase|uniref:NAD(P)-dependent oxidoreductase n=1 Tax=Ensifer sp. TaxID=1872086 RepID=UPI002E0E71EB|nr:NAD(P)-dependent oxidoreductase [Ensifer sp.]